MLSGGDQPFTIDCMPDGQQTNGLWKYHGLANQTSQHRTQGAGAGVEQLQSAA